METTSSSNYPNLRNLFKQSVATGSSSNYQVHLLKEFFIHATEVEKELLHNYLDPDWTSNFSSMCIQNSIEYCVNNSDNLPSPSYTFVEFCNVVANRRLTGTAAIQEFASIVYTEAHDILEICDYILAKKPCYFTYKTANKAYKMLSSGTFVGVFQCQLANVYKPEKHGKYGDVFFASPKMDGLRAYYLLEHDEMFTRGNKPYTGMAHKKTVLKNICKKYNLTMLDGEMYTKDIQFQAIQSELMNKGTTEKAVKYVIFAAISPSTKDTLEMVQTLLCIKDDLKSHPDIEVVEYTRIYNTPQGIRNMCIEYADQGYEGIMLRHAVVPYDYKRSDYLLKYKLFKETNATITGVHEGNNKYEGMLGALEVTGTIDGKAFVCEVGTGFTDEQRAELWRIRNLLICKVIEVKYQGVTDTGDSLRFPVFMKFK
jgi:DNA ligase-1